MRKLKRIVALLLSVTALMMTFGCYTVEKKNEYPTFEEGITYIPDVAYTTYYKAFSWNEEGYIGKKYAIDGMFKEGEHGGEKTATLFRYVTEEHGDHTHTYEYGYTLKGEKAPSGLEEGTWIRAIGTVKTEAHGDHTHIILEVESWEKLDEAGVATL